MPVLVKSVGFLELFSNSTFERGPCQNFWHKLLHKLLNCHISDKLSVDISHEQLAVYGFPGFFNFLTAPVLTLAHISLVGQSLFAVLSTQLADYSNISHKAQHSD
jgi:hypothetical protein